MNMLEIVTNEIKERFGGQVHQRHIDNYEYNVYCSPHVYEQIKEGIYTKGLETPSISTLLEEEMIVPKTLFVANIGYLMFHPVLTEGFRVEEIKN